MSTYDRKADLPSRTPSRGAPDHDFDAEHDPERARRVSSMLMRRQVQKRAESAASTEGTHAAAERGVASPTTSLPFADRIQSSFGASHDVSKIQAHVGGDSAGEMGAKAYATGNHVVFDRAPDLHTAAHEAAHVVQQARGVNLYGGIGEAGDSYEKHADAVADRVVAGQDAADLLSGPPGGAGGAVIQKKTKDEEPAVEQQPADVEVAESHRRTAQEGIELSIQLGINRIGAAQAIIETEPAAPQMTADAPLHSSPQIAMANALVDQETRRISRELDAGVMDSLQCGGPMFEHVIRPLANAYNNYMNIIHSKHFLMPVVAGDYVIQICGRYGAHLDSTLDPIRNRPSAHFGSGDGSALAAEIVETNVDALNDIAGIASRVESEQGLAILLDRAESHISAIQSAFASVPELATEKRDRVGIAATMMVTISLQTARHDSLRLRGECLLLLAQGLMHRAPATMT